MNIVDTVLPRTTFARLMREQRAFLEKAAAVPGDKKKGQEILAILIMQGEGRWAFLEDGPDVWSSANKMLAKEAPEGVCRAGTVGSIWVKNGVVVVPDERQSWWKPLFAGLVPNTEGGNPLKASMRELREEVRVFKKDRSVLYWPHGVDPPELSVPCLGIPEIKGVERIGTLQPVAWHRNVPEGVIELVVRWDLTGLPEDHIIAYDDDWFQGGYFGAPPVVLGPDGKPVGFYSGQQGYVSLGGYKLHPLFADPPKDYDVLRYAA